MSGRSLAPAMQAELDAGHVRPILMYEGQFASGIARYWTGYGTLHWNGVDFVGLGDLVDIPPIVESCELAGKGFTLALGGQDPAKIALALGVAAQSQGKPGKLWFGLLASDGSVIADPSMVRAGRLDVASGSDDGETARIVLSYEDRLVDLERPREFRYTPESQKLFYPDDKGFEFVAGLQDASDTWRQG